MDYYLLEKPRCQVFQFTSEALRDLDVAVVAAGGDEIDDEEECQEDDKDGGHDPIQELEAAYRAEIKR